MCVRTSGSASHRRRLSAVAVGIDGSSDMWALTEGEGGRGAADRGTTPTRRWFVSRRSPRRTAYARDVDDRPLMGALAEQPVADVGRHVERQEAVALDRAQLGAH